jgi:hypothetical protein
MMPAAPYLEALAASRIPEDRFISFDGFRSEISPARVAMAGDLGSPQRPWPWTGVRTNIATAREATIAVGAETFHALAYDDADDPVGGLDTVVVCRGDRAADPGRCAWLKPSPARDTTSGWSRPFAVVGPSSFRGTTYFRLFSLAPDGSEMTLYQRASAGLQSTVSEAMTDEYLDAAGGFVDDGFPQYRTGALGPRLWEGGDGIAERRLLEIVRLDLQFLERGTEYALSRFVPDVLFHYSQATDSAGHAWMGILDPDSPGHDAVLAARLWPFYEQVFALQDAWLGRVMALAGEDTIVTVVGDHGIRRCGSSPVPASGRVRASEASGRSTSRRRSGGCSVSVRRAMRPGT